MEERKTIYLCLAHMSEEGYEQKYVKEAFDTNWVVPMGPNVNAFEQDLANFANSKSDGSESLDRKVVCLSAGTAAVHLALLACGVGPGDEVCVQSFTFCASSHPITYLGAKPVFIDSESETWNMDPALLEKAILERKAVTGKYPKAIVPVALYGMPYKIDEIMAIANKYGIPVVEDAAEGMGSRFGGQVLGTFGTFGVLSFNGNKMITTSGGGALICRNADDANTVMWYATQARDAYPYYQHTAIGYNYRMSNVCAGIGRGQMTVLDAHIAHHKHVQALYEDLLADVPGVHIHKQPADPRYDANFWLCAATIDPEVHVIGQENAYKEVIKTAVGGAAGVIKAVDSAVTDCQPNENVEALRVFMLGKKVECRPVWKPMHKQPVYAGAPAYLNGVSESLFKVGFCLPAGPYVTDEDVKYIVDCIKEAIGASSVKMSDVMDIIRNKVSDAEKAKCMFFLPSLPSCLKVTETDADAGSTMGCDYLIQFPNGNEITIESRSRDGSRTFMMKPDRSHVYIRAYAVIDGKKTEVDSFTYGWDEKV